jgi:hypothetical protein
MLPGDDLVNVKGTCVRECRHVAIFATAIGPLPYVAHQTLSQS